MVKVGRPRTNGYEQFGFSLVKEKNKFVAICKICKRTLQNTAFVRLRGHRNICKPPSAVSVPQCSMFVSDDEIFFPPNQNEFDFPDCSMVLQDSGVIGDDEGDLHSCHKVAHDHTDLQDRKRRINLKKIAVLEIIKQNKNTLFEDPEADKSEIWKKVHQKAQSVGLASEDSHWTFARDSLYEMWKNHTLTKNDYGWKDQLDIVDIAIFKILGKKLPASKTIDLSDLNSDCSFEEYQQSGPTYGSNPTQKRSSQMSYELQEAELKIKKLKCESLEIEVYKQKLEALLLERQLKLPPSPYTSKLFKDGLKSPTDEKSIPGEPEAATIKSEVEDEVQHNKCFAKHLLG